MNLIDFSSWSQDSLIAYATLLTLATLVGVITVFFRELGAGRQSNPRAGRRGRFGFPPSHSAKTAMRVLQIRQLSPDVKSFRLLPEDGYLDYEAGQFLTFHLGDDGKLARCYSLHSSPMRPGTYEVAVKRLEDGRGSGWMHDKIAVGDVLAVTPPAGRFVLRDDADEIVLVAGGIGVTPCLAMLTYLVDTASPKKVVFIYAARTIADLVFKEEIEALAARAPKVHFIPVLTRPGDDWTGARGRIHQNTGWTDGIDFANAELYTCGPESLMTAVKAIAVASGMPSERFYNELFASPDAADIEPRKATILVNGDRQLAYNGKQNLLDFLEEHDLAVPCSCRAGVCGTCEIRITAGETESLNSEYLSAEDLAQGRRLACISFPKTDLQIET